MSKIKQQIKDAGKKLNVKELQSIAKKTGYTPESVVRRAEETGVTVKPAAKSFAQQYVSSSRNSNNNNNDDDDTNKKPGDFTPATGGLTAAETAELFRTLQTGEENLLNIQGQWSQNAAQIGANAAVSSAGIRADADKEVAKAYSDAQKYASSLGLEGVKYGADKESEWRQAVANIEVKGKLDLQPIINAGLERVAGIEAQASRDVAETTGKYSLESMKQRTAADKSIGKMQLAGSMYGLLGSVFG